MTVNLKNWQELKKPTALDLKTGSDAKRKATFTAEPLERGFGLTLGNSLRPHIAFLASGRGDHIYQDRECLA